MNTYTIYLNTNPIACIADAAHAYRVYKKACELAELIGKGASLVWDDEIIAGYGFDEEADCEEPADIDDDFGFDPYEGCYTYDC